MKRRIIAVFTVAFLGATLSGAPTQAATSYANCDALHRHWQYGVAKSRKAARRQVNSGHYKPHVSRAGYRANSNLDAGNDGTACEVSR